MRLERGNLVRITDDEVKIAKFKEEGYKEVEDVIEGKDDDVAEAVEEKATVEEMEIVEKEAIETAKEKEKADKEVEEVETAESDKEAKEAEEVEVAEEKAKEKKTTGRGRTNNKK